MPSSRRPEFGGWATAYNRKCTDGRVISPSAFTHQSGQKVPLMWMHQHGNPQMVVGHAILTHDAKGTGMYAECYLNNGVNANNIRAALENDDVDALSIHATKLKQKGFAVTHGEIKEVSLVLSGANPGAFIDFIDLKHGDDDEPTEAIIYNDLPLDFGLRHYDAANTPQEENEQPNEQPKEQIMTGQVLEHAEDASIGDIFDSLTEEQKELVYFLLAQNDEEMSQSDMEYGMPRNVFANQDDELIHADVLSGIDLTEVIATAKREGGSFRNALSAELSHADEHRIEDIELLFPDAKTVGDYPELLKRRQEYVPSVLSGTKHSPFTRIKSMIFDLKADELRAKGYVRGNRKVEAAMKVAKRVTTPKTIYVKRKMDRDDIVDITDFDVIAFIKMEMRMQLDEELARAILIGDGREADDVDKIDEEHLRPIYNEDPLFVGRKILAADSEVKDLPDELLRVKSKWKGTGRPSFFTTQAWLTEMLLLKDLNGRYIYENETSLASRIGVDKIVVVDPFESVTRERESDSAIIELVGILVNLVDYTVGADKGGEISFFEDFDIDFNQEKYLLETRVSGAMTKPDGAVVVEIVKA